MSVTPDIFDDPETREIFEQVVSQLKVPFRQLRENRDLDSTREKVRQLKSAHLIEERGAPLEDFSMLYVTAEGLQADRQLRRIARK